MGRQRRAGAAARAFGWRRSGAFEEAEELGAADYVLA